MDSPEPSATESRPAPSSPPPPPPPTAAQLPDAPMRDASPDPPREKVRYRSWRKKFRKMKHSFDDRMEDANELFLANWRAEQIARRLKEQNDQLLEILLDINDSYELPPTKRFDLTTSSSQDPTQALTPESPNARSRPEGGTKLTTLEQNAVCTSRAQLSPSLLPADLKRSPRHPPPGYMTATQEDQYLNIMDEALEALPLPNLAYPSKPIGNAVLDPNVDIRPRRYELPSERDFADQCDISVYNWIRQHQPQIHAEKEEKTRRDDRGGGADSDRGGRSPPPLTPATAGSKRKVKEKLKKEDLPFETLDDEIGFDANEESTFGTSRNKRKKDDEAYRPKGGKSRPSKRKRGSGWDESGGAADFEQVGSVKRAKKASVDEGAAE